jgi:hypothetical protein
MPKLHEWADLHLVVISAAFAFGASLALFESGDGWAGRNRWYLATACVIPSEWLIGFWWWDKHRKDPEGWRYVLVNQLVVLLMYALVIGTGWAARSALLGS